MLSHRDKHVIRLHKLLNCCTLFCDTYCYYVIDAGLLLSQRWLSNSKDIRCEKVSKAYVSRKKATLSIYFWKDYTIGTLAMYSGVTQHWPRICNNLMIFPRCLLTSLIRHILTFTARGRPKVVFPVSAETETILAHLHRNRNQNRNWGSTFGRNGNQTVDSDIIHCYKCQERFRCAQ